MQTRLTYGRGLAASRRQVLRILPGALLLGGAATADQSSQAHGCLLSLRGSGTAIDPAHLAGKVVYLDFWASWCAPCLVSFPFMNDLQKTFAGQGLQVLGVNMDENQADAERFLGEHPARFAVTSGPAAQCARDFGVAAMPSTFLIDRGGAVRFSHRGFRPGDATTLRAEVQTLLTERS